MTIKTSTGHSINRSFRAVERRYNWMRKIKNNGKILARIGNIVRLAKGWDVPPKDGQPNRLKLDYIGTATTANEAAKDIARIQKVLDTVLGDDMKASVKLGRITVEITLNVPWATVLRKAA